MTNSNIHQNVMRRVRAIHVLKNVVSGVGASVLLLAASLYFIGREVWVARVWQNMPSLTHADSFGHFFLSAFMHTNVIVQALILLTIFAGVWLLRELSRVLVIASPRLA